VGLAPESVHLVLTSPPYWTLKEYRDTEGQLGHVADYQRFLLELDKVWHQCYDALIPGGRLICVVGDVCLSRRKNNGRHTVVPLMRRSKSTAALLASITSHPLSGTKIANAVHEVENGSSFLGKPYEPNAVIKHDIEFMLMLRKPGGYRKPSLPERLLSVISVGQLPAVVSADLVRAHGSLDAQPSCSLPRRTRRATYRMFSFVGDTVLDPFRDREHIRGGGPVGAEQHRD